MQTKAHSQELRVLPAVVLTLVIMTKFWQPYEKRVKELLLKYYYQDMCLILMNS